MKWDRLILKIGIALVAAILVALVRVLIRAVGHRSRTKGHSVSLPPPPVHAPGQKPASPSTSQIKPTTKKPVLLGVAGVYKGAVVPIESTPIVIGRDPAVSNLVFPDEHRTISSRHCTIKLENGKFLLEDCFSTNGTYLVNGRSLTPGQAVELKSGERFTLGDRKNVFEVAFR